MQTVGNKRGFTLIELLVVIAIIAILAAILFPVFAQVREKARQITCASNEKQMGLALIQYTEDYDERFPMQQYFDTSGFPHDWPSAIYPYIKNGSGVAYSPTVTVYNGEGGIFSCPDFPVVQPENYGLNLCLARYGAGTATITASLSQIDAPSDRVAIMEKGAASTADVSGGPDFEVAQYYWAGYIACTNPDGSCSTNDLATLPENHIDLAYDFDEAAGSGAHSTYPWPGVMPRYRHQNHTNVLYVDGHVHAVAKGQLSWGQSIYIPGLYESLDGATY